MRCFFLEQKVRALFLRQFPPSGCIFLQSKSKDCKKDTPPVGAMGKQGEGMRGKEERPYRNTACPQDACGI